MTKNICTLIFILGFAMLLQPVECSANAITVTNVSIAGVAGGTADIQFDISWSNSWNLSWSDDGGLTTVTNWDAAWVFLKFKTASGTWRHGLLSTSGHTPTTGALIDIGSNGSGTNVGVFIRRSTQGSGPFQSQGMRLRWDFAQSSLGGTTDVDISVHAIEMVYIPSGPFALGSGGSEGGHFYKHPTSSNPYYVTNENAIAVSWTVAGCLHVDTDSHTLPAAYPKGYAAFYCMKYEISQGQYASFLNHLESGEADARYPNFFNSSRFTISVASNQYSAAAPDRACNYLSVADVSSYLDWAGLRPMTELEFEKVCRGTQLPEPNEFAWGTTTVIKPTGFSGVDGSGSETSLPATANCNYGSATNGPIRVGIFAEAGSSRQKAGAGYYGVMDLSGNVSELVVNANNSVAFYVPTHGDGVVGTPPDGWPSYLGFMRRGGSFSDATTELCTSRRDTSSSSTRSSTFGGRGVRTYQP